MSRVVRFSAFGGPEVLKIEHAEVPAPGPGQVRIDVQALGLNRAEALMRSGNYIERPRLPSSLGLEAAGIVESVGPGVTTVAPGQLVGLVPPISMIEWPVYAERIVVQAGMVIPSPPKLDANATAATWMAYLTAYGALIDLGASGAGDVVAITAASSSVGLAAIQIARMVGAKPIAITRTRRKSKRLIELGATAAVALEDGPLDRQLQEVAGGKVVKVALDAVGGPLLTSLASAMAVGGVIFEYGGLSSSETPFPLSEALSKQLMVRGYLVHHVTANPLRLEAAKRFVLGGLSEGDLRPVIDRIFPLDEIVQAHRYLESGHQIGKIVVTV